MPAPNLFSEEASSAVCVAHLVRHLNGLEPLVRFLEAYQRNSGGLQHDLLLLCKGFEADQLPPEYVAALSEVRYQTLFLPDEGFDIGPYFAAVRHTRYKAYCFLNSFSEPLDVDWLLKLYSCLQAPGVGLVGATGSWGSVLSYRLLELGRPSAYAGLIEKPVSAATPALQPKSIRDGLRILKRPLRTWKEMRWYRRSFSLFPTYHIRTNAFMLRRETMLATRCDELRDKGAAMRFESGRDSLTEQVLASGKSVLVAGRDGKGYGKETWAESGTFWGDQRNLLVADNQTLNYARASTAQRQFYARYAWGARAVEDADAAVAR